MTARDKVLYLHTLIIYIMKITQILALCLLACLLSACLKESEKYIKLINKSERDVVFQADNDNYFAYHDISYICQGLIFTIRKDSSYLYQSVDDTGWEADFNLSPYMTFMFMDEENYLQYQGKPCDTIRKYVPILHHYRVSLADMEQANWTIVYPPEEKE